jgi:hypothetical protein
MTDAEITLSNLDPYDGDTRTSAERNFTLELVSTSISLFIGMTPWMRITRLVFGYPLYDSDQPLPVPNC